MFMGRGEEQEPKRRQENKSQSKKECQASSPKEDREDGGCKSALGFGA